MNAALLEYTRPAHILARSLLEVWLLGDRRQLGMHLEGLSLLPLPPEKNDEFERIDLLKCVAWRMKESAEPLTPFLESPRTKIWFDLLRHLAKQPHYGAAGSRPESSPS
jgi:hypothetical protein